MGRANTNRAEVIPLRETTDEAIVAGVRAGESVAERELVRRYGRLLSGVVVNILGPRPELPDLMQEVLLVAFRDIHKLEKPGALRSWLIAIAVGRAHNHLRSERRRRWLIFRDPRRMPESATQPTQDGPMRAVYEALRKMSIDDRTHFAMRYLSGLTVPEMAEALEVSASTVKRRVAEARVAFDALAGDDPRLAPWMGKGNAS